LRDSVFWLPIFLSVCDLGCIAVDLSSLNSISLALEQFVWGTNTWKEVNEKQSKFRREG